jgi:hypothetical protein
MTTQLSTKFAALAVALMINGMMIGGVAYLFSGQIHQTASVTALAGMKPAAALAPI